jgi:pilus assembly protein CpaD
MKRFSILKACVAIAAVSLSACALTPKGPQDAFDLNARYPINVEPRMMTLRLPYNGQPALDQNATGQLARFAQDYMQHGSGTIAVSASTRYPNAPALVADQLLQLGVARPQIMVANSDAPDLNDDVKVTYIRYVAVTPPCGDWSSNLAKTTDNVLPSNFGCATQHNLAAMVADPRDLLAPDSSIGQPDAARRLTVLDKYRKGEPTPAAKTANGVVTQIGAGGM